MMQLWCVFKTFVQFKGVNVLFEEIKLCRKLKMIPIVA